jgi:hypothetical protein
MIPSAKYRINCGTPDTPSYGSKSGNVLGVVDFLRPALSMTIVATAKGDLFWSLFAIFVL